jgi:hypothetical protein
MSENYDATWMDYIRPQFNITTSSNSYMSSDLYREYMEHAKHLYQEKPRMGEDLFRIKLKLKKESPEMGYNNGYGDDNRSDAQKIDDAVREAIAKPRREAEIAKRIAAVSALESLKDVAVGTVITFTRKNARGDKKDVTYAALKSADNQWFVTGDGYRSNGDQQSFDSLLAWLTTGDTLAENVQAATKFAPVSAPAV